MLKVKYSGWLVLLILLTSCQKRETLFVKLPARTTGINFQNTLKESPDFNVLKYTYFYNGGGVSAGDVNNDGLIDLYFIGNLVASQLYINQGDLHFEEVAQSAGVRAEGWWNTGTTMADVNGDGWLDIYVCRSAAENPDGRKNLLFINNGLDESGNVSFTEEAATYGIDDEAYSTQASFFDYDRDGDLDLYLLNHSTPKYANFNNNLQSLKNKNHPHYGDKLYQNIDNHFVDVTDSAGIKTNVLGFGLGLSITDFDNDGWLDIYVSNDFNEEDYLYINQGNGRFVESLAQQMDYTSLFSMGSDAGDINNDGLMDLITLDMLPSDAYRNKITSGPDNYNKYQQLLQQNFYQQHMRNMLHVNQGNGRFKEVGQLKGISNTDWSWAALLADFDLDGYQDLFISNGYLRDYTNMDFLSYAVDYKIEHPGIKEQDIPLEDMVSHMPTIDVVNPIYKNNNGQDFSLKSDEWGFLETEMSNGATYADLDNDGDLELIINNVNAKASIYKNMAIEMQKGHFLKVKLVEEGNNNHQSIGSRATLYMGDEILSREIISSRGYQSSVPTEVHFGLGENTKVDSLQVIWSNGSIETFNVSVIDQLITVTKGQGKRKNLLNNKNTLFQPLSNPLFSHRENAFNDFDIQPLLPRMYSRQGPAMAQGHLNDDIYPDLVVTGASGDSTKIWMGNADGDFKFHSSLPNVEREDIDVTISDIDQDGDMDITLLAGGNGFPSGDEHYTVHSYLNNGQGQFTLNPNFPKIVVNGNTIVSGDLNGDDKVDLFIGSCYKAQQYPLSDANYVVINQGQGNFEVLSQLPFSDYHCSDAQIANVDHDSEIELVLVGEWERVEIWNYDENKGWKRKYQSPHTGWFQSVLCENIDNDDASEIIVGNWGNNSQFTTNAEEAMVLYYGDFDQNGKIDPILTMYNRGISYPFVSRDDLVAQWPIIKKQFNSYHEYALTTTEDILPFMVSYKTDTVESFESMIIDIQEGQLTTISLPQEAQEAPIYDILSLDIDNDGDNDIIMTGNHEKNRNKIGEISSNHGVVLENKGQLKFNSIPNRISGIYTSGDVRSSVVTENPSGRHLIFGINDGWSQHYILP
ncbi:VCBS repeat-containing protein [Membranihabitans marinus]|uniref:VCBS repeat-containing protein n=1 Tax=Membranihabitans marinus TaxID=1227546 RepID=UPI001F1ACD9E|nr:VCBS repeat-containing protein [Membranihabitans marinus]